jgi:hypothetical protein
MSPAFAARGRYLLSTSLKGHQGDIGCLAMTDSGRLASGGNVSGSVCYLIVEKLYRG